MNINEIGLKPNDRLSQLPESKFFQLLSTLIEELCLYKGIKYDDVGISNMLSMLYRITHNKLLNLSINDVTIGIETMMYTEDIKKISVQLIHKRLQKISIEKQQIEYEAIQHDYTKTVNNGFFGRAMSLRMLHDPGGKILDKNGDTLKEVMESVKIGICYYTGNHIELNDKNK
jgi:hypothetical protein